MGFRFLEGFSAYIELWLQPVFRQRFKKRRLVHDFLFTQLEFLIALLETTCYNDVKSVWSYPWP